MGSKNPLARIADAAQGAASLPLKVTEKVAGTAVGVVAGGARAVAGLINPRTSRPESSVGIGRETEPSAPTDRPVEATPPPGPDTVPPPLEPVEELADAAVAREMAEEPLDDAPAPDATPDTAPTPSSGSEKVFSTSTPDTSQDQPS